MEIAFSGGMDGGKSVDGAKAVRGEWSIWWIWRHDSLFYEGLYMVFSSWGSGEKVAA